MDDIADELMVAPGQQQQRPETPPSARAPKRKPPAPSSSSQDRAKKRQKKKGSTEYQFWKSVERGSQFLQQAAEDQKQLDNERAAAAAAAAAAPPDVGIQPIVPPAPVFNYCGVSGKMHWNWRKAVQEMYAKWEAYETQQKELREDDAVPDDSPHPALWGEDVPYDPRPMNGCFLCKHSIRDQKSDVLAQVVEDFKQDCRDRGFEAACHAFSRYYDENYRDKMDSTRHPWPAERIMWHFMMNEATDPQLQALYVQNHLQQAKMSVIDQLGMEDSKTKEIDVNESAVFRLDKMLQADIKMAKMLESLAAASSSSGNKSRDK